MLICYETIRNSCCPQFRLNEEHDIVEYNNIIAWSVLYGSQVRKSMFTLYNPLHFKFILCHVWDVVNNWVNDVWTLSFWLILVSDR
jgi:hypothetical protein